MRNYRPIKVDKSRRACPSGKYRYPDHECAMFAKRGTQNARGEEGAQRVYECPRCKGFHLTSQLIGPTE